MTSGTPEALLAAIAPVARIQGSRLVVTDEPRLRGSAIDALVDDAVFNPVAALRDAARW